MEPSPYLPDPSDRPAPAGGDLRWTPPPDDEQLEPLYVPEPRYAPPPLTQQPAGYGTWPNTNPWPAQAPAAPLSPYSGPHLPFPPGPATPAAGPASAAPKARPMLTAAAALGLLAGLLGGGLGASVITHDATAPRSSVITVGGGTLPAGSVTRAAKTIAPSVAMLTVTGSNTAGQSVGDTGSGIVLSADGYVLTNNHVVAAAETRGTVTVTLPGGGKYTATITGHDASSDLAVVHLTGAHGLHPARFADSDKVAIGQQVVAVGAPLGLANTVTAGIVSTVHRPVATGNNGSMPTAILDAIQTDAAINPGNSGGPLTDLDGRVIGVNSAIETAAGQVAAGTQPGNIGVGFAIPSNTALNIAQQLIKTGHADHPQMGIEVTGSSDGTLVKTVDKSGPAGRAGLEPGDVITALDGRDTPDPETLIAATRSHRVGQKVTVTYTRGRTRHTATFTLAAAPGN